MTFGGSGPIGFDGAIGGTRLRGIDTKELCRMGFGRTKSADNGLCSLAVFNISMVEAGSSIVGIADVVVRLLPNVESRRRPLRIFLYEALFIDPDESEGGAEGMDGMDDVETLEAFVAGCCFSLELHDVGCVDAEFREGAEYVSGALDEMPSAETLLVTRSRVVFGSCGTFIPRLSAVCRKC